MDMKTVNHLRATLAMLKERHGEHSRFTIVGRFGKPDETKATSVLVGNDGDLEAVMDTVRGVHNTQPQDDDHDLPPDA
jgi:hypothetical protein